MYGDEWTPTMSEVLPCGRGKKMGMIIFAVML